MMTKQQLRELALDAVTTPGVKITVIPAKRKMSDIRTEAFRKRAAEHIAKANTAAKVA